MKKNVFVKDYSKLSEAQLLAVFLKISEDDANEAIVKYGSYFNTLRNCSLFCELERRATLSCLEELVSSKQVHENCTDMKFLQYEIARVFYLDNRNHIIRAEDTNKGGWSQTLVDPKVILKRALELNAVGIILCHNHPSNSCEPSNSDKLLTTQIKGASNYLSMRFVDHLIITKDSYFSFAEAGML